MSQPQRNDITTTGIAAVVRWIEGRLRGIIAALAVIVVFILASDHFSPTSIIVACVIAIFAAAAWLVLRAFAGIGRGP